MTKTIAQQDLPFRQPGDKGKEEIEMTKFTVIINGAMGPHKYQVEAEDYITAESIATEQHIHACPFESEKPFDTLVIIDGWPQVW